MAQGEIDGQHIEFQVLAPRGPIDVPRLERIPVRQVGQLTGHLWTQLELPFFARDGLLFLTGQHPSADFLGAAQRSRHCSQASPTPSVRRLTPGPSALSMPCSVPFGRGSACRRRDHHYSEAEKTHILSRYPAARGRLHAVHHGAPTGCTTRGPPTRRAGARTGQQRPPFRSVGWHAYRPEEPTGGDRRADEGQPGNAPRPRDRRGEPTGPSWGRIGDPPEIREGGSISGRQTNDTEGLRRLYETAVALILPSFYESFGLPALEAMRFGCPVVASDIPGTARGMR